MTLKHPVVISGAVLHFSQIHNWNQIVKNGWISSQPKTVIQYIPTIFTIFTTFKYNNQTFIAMCHF